MVRDISKITFQKLEQMDMSILDGKPISERRYHAIQKSEKQR